MHTIIHPLSINSPSAKDKPEKSFAFAYLKVMNDNGSIISDGTHELLVYEVIITSFPGIESHVIPADGGKEMDRPCCLLQPAPQS